MWTLVILLFINRHFSNLLAGKENYIFTMDYIVRLDFELLIPVHSDTQASVKCRYLLFYGVNHRTNIIKTCSYKVIW